MPRASATLATIGRPSGTAATTSATPVSTIRSKIAPGEDADDGGHGGDDHDHDEKPARQAVQPLLQRRHFFLGFLGELRDVTELGVHACRHDHAQGAARC